MGIKAIKEKYNIQHLIQKRDDIIWIGSPYISEIIGINTEGKLIKLYKNRKYNDGWSTNEDLKRYQEEMLIDQESGELKKLVEIEDDHNIRLTVFTYSKGKVIKKQCEVFGWPNLTVDGEMMYDNTFFKSYDEAFKSLLKVTSLKYPWDNYKRRMSDLFKQFKNINSCLFRDVKEYVYSRTIQRLSGIFINLKK